MNCHTRLPLLPLFSLAACLLLAACAVTRVDPPPPVQAPVQFKESGEWQHAATAATPVPDDWWTLFKDPVIDDLQKRLVIGNENLKSQVAAMASARATLEASRSALFPTLSTGLSATRSSSPNAAGGKSVNNESLAANAGWEIDLWGRLAQSVGRAQSALQASADDLAAARLSAQATLAQTYFAMRTAEVQQSLLERSVQAYQRSLDLTQARYDGGVAALSDVLQAQTQIKTTQAQLVDAVAQRAQLEHAIAVLIGVAPSSFTIARTSVVASPPVVPEMLPSTLLERRPDIAAAQRRVAAAYAQIGVADAAFFPTVNLSAGVGYAASTLTHLAGAPNLFWSLGSTVAQTIFDGGQRKLASAQARATADQATSTYRQTVLTSLQEVEDNLVLANQLQTEAQLLEAALQYAQRNVQVTLDQYGGGTVSYLNVVIAQTAALTSEINLLAVRNRQLAAVNLLLKNIAGRWDNV